MPNENVVKIGVFLPADTQLLDMACVDVYAMMGKDYLAPLTMLPKHISEAAPHVRLLYITSPGNDTMTVPTTAAVSLRATNVYTDAEVQPGELDILVVPGADPEAKWQQGALDFLSGHARCGKADILSVCTGIFLCGEAGLLDGRRASGPRGLVDRLKKQYPKTGFVGQEYRWVQDGNFWSSGGITNGNDLVAAHARTGKHFPPAIAELACQLADVGDRAQIYSQGQARFTLSLVWVLIKGWFS